MSVDIKNMLGQLQAQDAGVVSCGGPEPSSPDPSTWPATRQWFQRPEGWIVVEWSSVPTQTQISNVQTLILSGNFPSPTLDQQAATTVQDAGPTGITLRTVALCAIDQFNNFRQKIIGTASPSWNPGSLANGAGITSPALTITGAAFGDFVDVACSVSLSGLLLTAYVSAANTVQLRLHNATGAAVNLGASGAPTWNVCVRRGLAQITDAAAKQALIDMANSGRGG